MELFTEEWIRRNIQINSYLNEGKADLSNYVCIGEIPSSPWVNIDKCYIMVSPQKVEKWGEQVYLIYYTQNSDGSGAQTDSMPYAQKCQAVIYPEHMDDEYGELFLGKRKDSDTLGREHAEFYSKLFIMDGKIVLHHNSSYKIGDGVVRKGKMNGYSNNTDIGIYFWGSRNSGKDPSNDGAYTYYCLIDKGQLYDFETNEERLSLKKAMEKYGYAGQFWQNGGDAVVVSTFLPTPIAYILEKQSGKWYDRDWNEIGYPF